MISVANGEGSPVGNAAYTNATDPGRRLRRREFLTAIGGTVLAVGAVGLLAGCNNGGGGDGETDNNVSDDNAVSGNNSAPNNNSVPNDNGVANNDGPDENDDPVVPNEDPPESPLPISNSGLSNDGSSVGGDDDDGGGSVGGSDDDGGE